jgi:hypothetical protein
MARLTDFHRQHLLKGVEVEGSAITEAVPVPEAEVTTGAATEPTEIASGVAPGVTEEVHDDVLPGSNLKESSVRQKFRMQSRSVWHRCSRSPRLVVVDSSFWRMILLTRRQ